MKTNKKIICSGIALLVVAFILLTVHFTFFKCSVPYTVSCHYTDSEEIKEDILHFIPCTSDKDCSIENMNSFCSPGFPNLLKCGSSKYYCDDGVCKGCDCIGPSYDVDERTDGIYEKRDGDVIKSIHKVTKFFIFGYLVLIMIIVAIIGLILCKMTNKKTLFCRFFGVVSIAFLSGVVFQLCLIIILDSFGLDVSLGFFMLPLLFIVPLLISILVSYFYHSNKTDIILTVILTLIFTIIALNWIAIG